MEPSLDGITSHIKDAVILYDLKMTDMLLMNLILRESLILNSLPPAEGARLLRALAHTLDGLAEERAK